MTVKEFLESTFNPNNEYNLRKRIKCVDGFSLSVQGGTHFHYCQPRELCNYYDKVEIGFPSENVPEFEEYKDEDVPMVETICGYVPIEIVEEVIKKHGGITK